MTINGDRQQWNIAPGDLLLDTLREQGYLSVKSGGCDHGECGACTILLDGKPVNSCTMLSAQADGHQIETIDSVGLHPDHGWLKQKGFHVLQQTFIANGAIQCGYCTPAMILAAKALIEKEPNPTEEQVRQALSGVLCRCTGYVKPVQAVLRAAAILRGEEIPPVDGEEYVLPLEEIGPQDGKDLDDTSTETGGLRTETKTHPVLTTQPEVKQFHQVGKPEPKVDAVKLAQGKPAFTADIEMRGMLIAKVLHSPIAHARIKRIDTSRARALPGVAAVLTWQDIPRVAYSTAGQSDPIPGPLDTFSLDQRVRFVGDRVAFVAAETEQIAYQALKLIDVEYEPLPAL
ncbi:MAG: 2Fe-2S iron-sulfur cluster-binding protein, partial [Anaerolineaceae bacterium]|nr:2Fe-2S iron-sulfur cluster-binding protein [Anaerolineaceae bacterium]